MADVQAARVVASRAIVRFLAHHSNGLVRSAGSGSGWLDGAPAPDGVAVAQTGPEQCGATTWHTAGWGRSRRVWSPA